MHYFRDNLHLYNIESFSSVQELVCSLLILVLFYVLQEDFINFLMWLLLCLFLGILYLLLLLEIPTFLPHYIIFIILIV